MRLQILGSGGAIPTPKIGCKCQICNNARTVGYPFKRNSSSLFLWDSNVLFDCPEDISSSINENNILEINAVFITHWHPDHCFGLRLLMQSGYDFYHDKVLKKFNLYIPKKVYEILLNVYPAITFQLQTMHTANLILLEDRDCIEIGCCSIQAIGFSGPQSDTFGYLISENDKRVLYSPCDTLTFKTYVEFTDLNLWITECGCFSDYDKEISIENAINRITEINPKRTIFTHIEEEEIRDSGWNVFENLEKQYIGIDFAFAIDKMEIEI